MNSMKEKCEKKFKSKRSIILFQRNNYYNEQNHRQWWSNKDKFIIWRMLQFPNSDIEHLEKNVVKVFLGFVFLKNMSGLFTFNSFAWRVYQRHITFDNPEIKSDFSWNLCFTVLFIYLKPHLSFKQLSDLTRSRDFRTVKRVFVSDRILGTKTLMKALMRKFLNPDLFFLYAKH